MDFVKLALKALEFLRTIARIFEGAQQRKAGRDEVRADALARESEDLRNSQVAANEASDRHKSDPTDAAFKSTPFRD